MQHKPKYLAIFVLLAIATICVTQFTKTTQENTAEQILYEEIKQEVIVPPLEEEEQPQPSIDFEGLSKINPDTVGWVHISNTNMDYPVVQGEDNQYYVTHGFNKKTNAAGAIFLDYLCEKPFAGKTLLYGHNMKNGTMFATLKKYLDETYFLEHPTITITTPVQQMDYTVFAVLKVPKDDEVFALHFSDFNQHVTSLKGRSIFSQVQPPEDNRDILVLSTCATSGSDERIAVCAYLSNIHKI